MAMSGEQQDEQAKAYGCVVAKAWSDDAFKPRLLAEPATVLRENGIELPAGMQVQIHEATATQAHFVLPVRPEALSDEQLEAVAGGGIAAARGGVPGDAGSGRGCDVRIRRIDSGKCFETGSDTCGYRPATVGG